MICLRGEIILIATVDKFKNMFLVKILSGNVVSESVLEISWFQERCVFPTQIFLAWLLLQVREATSNDPWGPSSSQMADISDLTYNVVACNEIMTMLWKRLKDDKNWRHIHKVTLTVHSIRSTILMSIFCQRWNFIVFIETGHHVIRPWCAE